MNPKRENQLVTDLDGEPQVYSYLDGKTTFVSTLADAFKQDSPSIPSIKVLLENIATSASVEGTLDCMRPTRFELWNDSAWSCSISTDIHPLSGILQVKVF